MNVETSSTHAAEVAPPTAVGDVLRCTDLRRSFGAVQAVDAVSFRIHAGETYGLLGPNGAGKTTVISMVSGVLEADSGSVLVDGVEMHPGALTAKAAIGYVPQDVALYPDLTGRENLLFFASLYRIGRRRARSRVAEVLDIVGLTERASDRVETYSGGMKRRLNIAVGLIHRPRLLVLDEPTVGVDPQSRNAILGSVERLSTEGMGVLYTTHYMEEAERLCDRVAIMDLGRLIAEGRPRQLTARLGDSEHIRLTLEGDSTRAVAALRDLPRVTGATATDDAIDVLVPDAESALPQVIQVAAAQGTVRSVSVDEPDLETVFLRLTGKRLRD
ncbi:ABC-2 type transport system ATP-binding protein [Nocardioides sp. YR527]|uniref:ABC transporter ATP-binding protein n=1 Tax=Nocardioides sp. YR527 TaxID=1881028 RepID=UPI00088D87CC|nr:ABC transporter ATP-binding protein [Nocardioides sp. YR527]SDK53336.1 ABC-2 type transport system ATP-binding protein [Nocardioides sp. YR527]